MKELLSGGVFIIIFVLSIFYFKLYHKMFRVVYFRNMLFEIFWEFLVCFVLAMFTVGLVLGAIRGLFKFVGKGLLFVLKLALPFSIVVLIGCIGYKIFKTVHQDTKKSCKTNGNKDIREKSTENNIVICPECNNICSLENQFCEQCGHRL